LHIASSVLHWVRGVRNEIRKTQYEARPLMPLLKRLLPLLCLLAVLMRPAPAQAEMPILEPGDYGGFDNPQPVSEPWFMWFVMGKLHSKTDIDVSAFDYPAGQRFKAEIFIPAHDDLKDFSPDIALVGPGLPQPADPLPFKIPQGMGAVIARSNSTYAYFDIFTQMTYYPRAKIEIENMPQSARYYMVVFGKPVGRSLYALDIGIMETFAPQALIRYPINWYEVRYALEWGYRPLLLLPLFLLMAYAWWKRTRKRQRKTQDAGRLLVRLASSVFRK
jgi:hypothetical protein